MERNNKTYAFTIAVKELRETVPNIFRYASAYKRTKGLKSKGLWEMFLEPAPEHPTPLPKDDPKYQAPLPEEILSTEPGHGNLPDIDPEAMDGESYNMCHFWSNFEIARLDWFRSQEYEDFFQMMDRSGGFWMERVGLGTLYIFTALLTSNSGETLPFTPWPPELFSGPAIFIISVTLATDIPRSNIAQQTPQLASYHVLPIWR